MWALMRAQKYPLPRAEALSCRGSVSSQRVVPSASFGWASAADLRSCEQLTPAWLWERGNLLPSSRPSQLRAQLPLHSIVPEPPQCSWIFTSREPASPFSLRPSAVHHKTQFFVQNSCKIICFCWFHKKDYTCMCIAGTHYYQISWLTKGEGRLQNMIQAF